MKLNPKYRENLNELLLKSQITKNRIVIHRSNSLEHELKKAEISIKLYMCGYDFITEAEFKKGGRADVFCIDTGEIYEVCASESEARFSKKKYPFKVKKVRICESRTHRKKINRGC